MKKRSVVFPDTYSSAEHTADLLTKPNQLYMILESRADLIWPVGPFKPPFDKKKT
jgi:hypothetical protein